MTKPEPSPLYARLAGSTKTAKLTADYGAKKKAMAAKSKAETRSAQDIGDIPAVKNRKRRRQTQNSFRAFCEVYFSAIFCLAWSPDHLRIIAKIERVIKRGESLAVAMPRGSGKSSLCEVAALWALVTGRHPFVFLIAAEAGEAALSLDNLKAHLSGNQKLAEDYPEVCFPIWQLDGESRRCAGQRHHGELTHIEWGSGQIVLPTIPGSKASAGIVRTSGILGHIRGAKFVTPAGEVVRPSLAILDDPQTDASAKSFLQTRERMKVLQKAIRNMGGPGRRCAVIIPCTIIIPGDMAAQVLDRQEHPEFHGELTRALYHEPTDVKLWQEYAKIRREAQISDRKDHPETAFYRANRTAMDAGAEVAWDARHGEGEISGLQFCMNMKQTDPAGFAAEFQNDPMPDGDGGQDTTVTAATILTRLNGLPRGTLPLSAQHLTAFVDVHDELLYWLAVAWGDGFTGCIVDYGAWPDQQRPYWEHTKPPIPLWRLYQDHGREAQIRQGLMDLTAKLAGQAWHRLDGAELRMSRIGIDTGYEPDQVYDVCRSSPHAGLLLPCRGVGLRAASRPMAEYARRPGDRQGWHWYLTPPQKGLRTAHVDVNHWKTFIQSRWSTAIGDPGSLSLYGQDKAVHEFAAEHFTGELPTLVEANGRKVQEWKAKPAAAVHWLDCLVGSAAMASFAGVTLAGGIGVVQKQKRPRIRLSDRQQQRS